MNVKQIILILMLIGMIFGTHETRVLIGISFWATVLVINVKARIKNKNK